MSCRNFSFALFALLTLCVTALAARYEIPAVVFPTTEFFPDGGVVAGFIETDGSIGAINADNIVDYRLDIEGGVLVSPTRTPQNSFVSSTGLLASDTDLFLEADESSRLRITVPDFVLPNSIIWTPHLDSELTELAVSVGLVGAAQTQTLYEGRVPYGIAVIPEPTTAALAGIALIGLSFRTSRGSVLSRS